MPEVPQKDAPRLWPALIFLLVLGITFLFMDDILQEDKIYVDQIFEMIDTDSQGLPILRPEGHAHLKNRPLLQISPSRGDWDFIRLFFANFVHGSSLHLLLNLIGIFAGVRICSTYLPFFRILIIFILGGSMGLLASMFLSSEISEFIPHIGSSAGIFALMGVYYIYNFKYRTRYFFWFPSRRGVIALKTSWFFFLDVILLEIILSLSQFFPNRFDSVDHLAHVVGFVSGVSLALLLKTIQRWPPFIQTWREFLLWKELNPKKMSVSEVDRFNQWLEILKTNPYNDQIKIKMCMTINRLSDLLSDDHISRSVFFLSPTFIRLYPKVVSSSIRTILARGRFIPLDWFKKLPYDSMIYISKYLAQHPEEQILLFLFIADYQKVHPEGGGVNRKVELLINKLRGIIPQTGSLGDSDKSSSATTMDSSQFKSPKQAS